MSHSYERVIIICLLVVIVIFKNEIEVQLDCGHNDAAYVHVCYLHPDSFRLGRLVSCDETAGVTCLAPHRKSSGSDASCYYT